MAAYLLVAGLSSGVDRAWGETGRFGHDPQRLLFFASTDLWRHGGFAHGGVVWSPFGLDRHGLVLKLMFGGGLYRYISGGLGNAEVRGHLASASILPGYRFVGNGVYATVYFGYDFQDHSLTPDDPSAGLNGTYVGMRTGFDVWYQPSATTMVAADASISTVGPSYSARVATGLRAFDLFFVGPELQAFAADDNYGQVRAGLHVTGLRTEQFEWSGGLGWAYDSDERGSAYGKLGVIARR